VKVVDGPVHGEVLESLGEAGEEAEVFGS
jgi:hypothetical protein